VILEEDLNVIGVGVRGIVAVGAGPGDDPLGRVPRIWRATLLIAPSAPTSSRGAEFRLDEVARSRDGDAAGRGVDVRLADELIADEPRRLISSAPASTARAARRQ
jgi:hypothetical protein